MNTDYDERVLENWRLPKGQLIMKLEQAEGLEYETELKTPCQLFRVVLF